MTKVRRFVSNAFSRLREKGARLGRRPFLLIAAVAAGAILADILFPPPISRAHEVSAIVADRNGYWLHAFATKEGRWRFSADLDEIDPAFVTELIEIEDKRFWTHWGVDPAAVIRAAASAAKSGRVVSGASTITMQTARLLEPRDRTLGAKLIEMLRAIQLERRLTKREILELYLTLAPYGGNLEGVRAASLIYYGREPDALTPAERAMLIALPQAPEARRPDRRQRAAAASRNLILDRLAAAGVIDRSIAAESKDAPVIGKRKIFPRFAYHASLAIARERKGTQSTVRSTIDIAKQQTAERLVADHVKNFKDGATAAAVIVDSATGEVLASVGSSSLDVDGGWIDLTDRVRSPGSLLKPFIYALAFEDGVLGPDTVIDDMPRGFGGYRPENFDRTFRGEVRVKDALQHSLNVPAVATLDRVGVERFAALLRNAGARLMQRRRADARPTLAMALGGAGVTMRDVATLYDGLANEGRVRPLVWTVESPTKSEPGEEGVQLFAADTVMRINAILEGAPALKGRAPAALSRSAPVIAYKTGTSYGYRDAWSAGHAESLTIVVWVGRADGAPRPGATGRDAAAPLLFALFDAFTAGKSRRPSEPEPDLLAEGLVRMAPPPVSRPPTIVFPVPGSEIYPGEFGGEGVVLAASGGAGGYRWYVDGEEVRGADDGDGAVWRPGGKGFYDVAVVDARGMSASVKVRVAALE
ncbi:MAG: penicillin-binding protein 1C [Parvularculaceae bacterium]